MNELEGQIQIVLIAGGSVCVLGLSLVICLRNSYYESLGFGWVK
jgi:hypothetical protein